MPALENEISGGSKARPHAFPWVVRLTGGCPRGLCGASLITTRHILTSFHCTYYSKKGPRPCDHSDGGWVVVGGARDAPRCAGSGQLRQQQPAQLLLHPGHRCGLPAHHQTPDIKYPPHAQLTERDLASHDFAMGFLKVGA